MIDQEKRNKRTAQSEQSVTNKNHLVLGYARVQKN